MKKLKQYLRKNKMKQSHLAHVVETDQSTILRLANGTIRDPRVSLAVKIERATGGEVKCEDWVK